MTQAVLKNQVTDLKPEIGLSKADRKKLAEALAVELADTYRLLINTQGVHWNVQGPLFYSLHTLTEQLYRDLFEAIDNIAERIGSLGYAAPQSLTEFDHLSTITDLVVKGELEQQIEQLVEANEKIANHMRETIGIAEKHKDYHTAELLIGRIGTHEQNAWMLRATVAA